MPRSQAVSEPQGKLFQIKEKQLQGLGGKGNIGRPQDVAEQWSTCLVCGGPGFNPLHCKEINTQKEETWRS